MSCAEDRCWDALTAHELYTAEEAARLKRRFDGDGRSARPTEWLVDQGMLTEYQRQVLDGVTDDPLRVGPYLILNRIASGRLAGMFRARHRKLQFPVCLKVLRIQSSSGDARRQLARFQREARVSVQVDHPNVVRTLQVGCDDGRYFIALENLQGESLAEMIAGCGPATAAPPDFDDILEQSSTAASFDFYAQLLRGAAWGLGHLHDRDVVHGDMQPANVWVGVDGSAKLLDFGLARDSMSFLDDESSDAWAASPASGLYRAPELADGSPSTKLGDVFGLGAVLYSALSGRPLPARSAVGELPPIRMLNPATPEGMALLVDQLTAFDVSDRCPSADEAARLFKVYLSESDTVLGHDQPSSCDLADFRDWLRTDEESSSFSIPLSDLSPDDF